jgi:RNA polymerase sigma factor (sigma-70 family)
MSGFPTTRWSRIVEAGDPDNPSAREALAELCSAYWYPAYAFIRRRGHDSEAALDLAQAYFTRLLEKGTIGEADPDKGRFRNFLMADCSHFLADHRDREQALKRGGRHPLISIDARDAEGRFLLEPAHEETPERLFERDWALALIARAFDRIERHYAETGRTDLFRRLKPIVSAAPDAASYGQIAAELGMTEGNVRVSVHRLRARFADALREEVAATIGDPGPAVVDDELRSLFAALST